MLNALDKAWERNRKKPLLDVWEAVEGGNCAKCGKTAKLRWKNRDRRGDKIYCSHDCALDDMKINFELPKEKANLICEGCHEKDKDVYQMEDGRYYHKSCF